MFKKLITTLAASILTGIISVSALAASDAPVYFGNENEYVFSPVESKNITATAVWEFTTDPSGEVDIDDDENITISNVKSSNKKVAVVDKSWTSKNMIGLDYSTGCGTTVITFTANGKTYSQKLTVKYNCPVSTFVVDKTNALSTFKKKNIFTSSKVVKNKKVNIKAKKGWIIDEVSITTTKKIFKTSTKTTKVNKASWSGKCNFTAPYDGIIARCHNVKTGEKQTCNFELGLVPGYSFVAG